MTEPRPIGWRLGCGGFLLGGYGIAAIVLSVLTLVGLPGGGWQHGTPPCVVLAESH